MRKCSIFFCSDISNNLSGSVQVMVMEIRFMCLVLCSRQELNMVTICYWADPKEDFAVSDNVAGVVGIPKSSHFFYQHLEVWQKLRHFQSGTFVTFCDGFFWPTVGEQSKCCGYTENGAGDTGFDCVIIPGALKKTALAKLNYNEFCGANEGLITDAGSPGLGTVCCKYALIMPRWVRDNMAALDVCNEPQQWLCIVLCLPLALSKLWDRQSCFSDVFRNSRVKTIA